MKKNYKKIIILVLLLINCIGFSQICNARITNNLTINNDRLKHIKEKGVLTVISSNDPPFAFIDARTNEPTGIDIDIMREIAKELGVNNIEMKVVPFVDIFDKLTTDDSIDVAVNGIAITEERKKIVNFTNPLYRESEALIVPKVSLINFKEDLKNSVIGVKIGTVYADLAEKWKKEGTIKDMVFFKSIPEIFSAIMNKQVDAGLMDSIIGQYLIFKDNLYLKKLEPYTPQAPEIIGVAVRKSDITLLNAMNKKIKEMKEDKTIKKILKKYGLGDEYWVNNITKSS
ncbi:ABC transporter substrate-binding protein [Clostridium taeniosporum]|uniref:Amino acid ABC transporter substrate-binding protein n=1 Tax=Clostridium taeniosporum TaxID=394958 RepID=A0A1D7XHI5_9CLOT|nr:ABC transporter substrate-binding protein [Clostridium taeniosporum]AOR22797.1 amino acid ABC transporter substrate-binding protein [Clostridium taeniosporum]